MDDGISKQRFPKVRVINGFRSPVAFMMNAQERLWVMLENGKLYKSNGTMTRWHLVKL